MKANDDFNPFCNAGVAIENNRDFVGRKSQLERQKRLSIGTSAAQLYSFWGLPRMGKTCLMVQLARKCEEASGGSCIALYSDVSKYNTKSGDSVRLWWRLCQDLATKIEVTLMENSQTLDIESVIDCFMRLLEKVKGKGKFVLLILDEFCTCLKMQSVECDNFINNFRAIFGGGLANRGLVGVLRCRVVSRRNPDFIESRTRGSTLKGVFGTNVVQLGPFKRIEFDEQCAKLPNKLSKADADFLWVKTGGHPYLTALILKEYRDQEIDGEPPSLLDAISCSQNVIDAHFSEVVKLMDEIGSSADSSVLQGCGLYHEYLERTHDIEIETETDESCPSYVDWLKTHTKIKRFQIEFDSKTGDFLISDEMIQDHKAPHFRLSSIKKSSNVLRINVLVRLLQKYLNSTATDGSDTWDSPDAGGSWKDIFADKDPNGYALFDRVEVERDTGKSTSRRRIYPNPRCDKWS